MERGRSKQDTGTNGAGATIHRARLLGTALGILLLASGCGLLSSSPLMGATPTLPAEPGPAIVVTVGGVPAFTPTPAVAATIPDSTPLPRIDLPTPDPASVTASPAASAGRSGVSAAARAAQPPPMSVPVAPRSSPSPSARQ